jgi:hypothetical protein
MATVQIGSPVGALTRVDKRNNYQSATSPISSTLWAASRDQASLDTQLATFNAAYYTAARIQEMTYWDKIYALTVAYDNAGI